MCCFQCQVTDHRTRAAEEMNHLGIPEVSTNLLPKADVNVALHMTDIRVNSKKCTVLLYSGCSQSLMSKIVVQFANIDVTTICSGLRVCLYIVLVSISMNDGNPMKVDVLLVHERLLVFHLLLDMNAINFLEEHQLHNQELSGFLLKIQQSMLPLKSTSPISVLSSTSAQLLDCNIEMVENTMSE